MLALLLGGEDLGCLFWLRVCRESIWIIAAVVGHVEGEGRGVLYQIRCSACN